MGWFRKDSLAEELFEVDVAKKYGYWDSRLRNYPVAITGCLIFLVAIIAMVAADQNQKKNLSWGKIKPGDLVYVPNDFLTDTVDKEVIFARLIRPVTIADIDTMQISDGDKRRLAAELDTNLKHPIMLEKSDLVIPKDSIFKYGSAAIGQFVAKDSTIATSEDGAATEWYEIIPDKRLLYDLYILPIPKGYLLIKDKFFMRPYDVRLEEPEAISKYKGKLALHTDSGAKHVDTVQIKKVSSAKTVVHKKRKARKHKKAQ